MSTTRDRCAVCWLDPKTGRRGTNDSTWICRRCHKSPANVGWQATPSEEIYGLDEETIERLGRPMEWKTEAGPYESPLCIQIMKNYCLGMSWRKNAAANGCHVAYVIETIAFWKRERPYFLARLRSVLASSDSDK